MKRLLFVALALVVAGSAVAENGFGLWRVVNEGAWNEYWLNYLYDGEPAGNYDLYITIHERTMTSIAGFECGIDYPSNVLPTALSIPNSGINAGDLADLLVGYNVPIVSSDLSFLVLATLQVYIDTTPPEASMISFRGARYWSIPGHDGPVVVDGADLDLLVACGYWWGDPQVFFINRFGGPIGTVDSTWSSVKSLFSD
jgi:hypothetical protein